MNEAPTHIVSDNLIKKLSEDLNLIIEESDTEPVTIKENSASVGK